MHRGLTGRGFRHPPRGGASEHCHPSCHLEDCYEEDAIGRRVARGLCKRGASCRFGDVVRFDRRRHRLRKGEVQRQLAKPCRRRARREQRLAFRPAWFGRPGRRPARRVQPGGRLRSPERQLAAKRPPLGPPGHRGPGQRLVGPPGIRPPDQPGVEVLRFDRPVCHQLQHRQHGYRVQQRQYDAPGQHGAVSNPSFGGFKAGLGYSFSADDAVSDEKQRGFETNNNNRV